MEHEHELMDAHVRDPARKELKTPRLYLTIGVNVVIWGAAIAFMVNSAISSRRQHAQDAIVADERYALLSESGEYSVSRTAKELARVPGARASDSRSLTLHAEHREPYMLMSFLKLHLSIDLVKHEFTPLLNFRAFFLSLHSEDLPLIRKLTGLTPEGEFFFAVPFTAENTSLVDERMFNDGPKYYMSLFDRNELVARLLRGEEIQLRLYTDEGVWNLSVFYDDMDTISEWQQMIGWVRSMGYESRWLSEIESGGP